MRLGSRPDTRARPLLGAVASSALAVTAPSAPVGAQPAVPQDWTCQSCPFATGLSSTWSVGSGFVSDDSNKFGDFTGLNDEGFYLLADGELRYWGDTGSYWELLLADLGLDSRSMAFDGGQPGTYRIQLSYDEIPRYRYEHPETPYVGVGGASLTLPSGWTTAGSTAGMTQLAGGLRPFGAERQRKTLGLGLEWLAAGAFDYRVDYRRDERTGANVIAGSFASLSALLPAPVDYVTDEFEVAASRTFEGGGFEVAFLGSEFSNRYLSLEWENPFTPLVTGADAGRLALAPDNSAEQLRVSGNYRLGSRTHLSGTFAAGRLEQDELFLNLSVNPAFAGSALPRTSLAGKVDTEHLNVAIVAQPLDRLRVTARHKRAERDNKTAQAVYDVVLTDLAATGARMNIPYGFERSETSVQADYRLPNRVRLKGGIERDTHDRTFQARNRSEEDSIWAKLNIGALDRLQATVGVEARSRTGSDYSAVDLGVNLQNPLLRQYHLADRDQRIAGIDLAVTPHERVNVLLRLENARDRYPASVLGLTKGTSNYGSLDASAVLPDGWNLYASWSRDEVAFDQAASQRFAGADWYASTEDTTNTRSLGFTKSLADGRWNLSFDVTDSRSRGVTSVRVGIPAEPFPDFTTDLDGLSFRVDYTVSEALSLQAGYRYERYSTTDWQLDGVDPATISNVLTLGALSPAYTVDMLTLSFAYSPDQD